ncbi:MAG TPA: DinB family protein [Thermoanaerobaculia bacterium]|nr:DinB family protein [Thermoanaerobaculia bacterium]
MRESVEALPMRGNALRRAVAGALPKLRAVTEPQSAVPRAPGKWSPREVMGHLIDSASNNHQRFVRAQFQEDLVFPGYVQDEWVRHQNYREEPWADLVELWRLYNLHLARVMDEIPEELWRRETRKHTFDEILMVAVPAGQPATLEHLRRDYVAHLQHHVEQIPGPAS